MTKYQLLEELRKAMTTNMTNDEKVMLLDYVAESMYRIEYLERELKHQKCMCDMWKDGYYKQLEVIDKWCKQ